MRSTTALATPAQALPFETVHLGMSAAVAVIRSPDCLVGFESPWKPGGPEIERMFLAVWAIVYEWATGPIDEDLFTFESTLLFKRKRHATFSTTCAGLLEELITWGATALEERFTEPSGKRFYVPAPPGVLIRTCEDMHKRYGPVALRFHTQVTAYAKWLNTLARIEEVRTTWERS